jgi:hypothetical protein
MEVAGSYEILILDIAVRNVSSLEIAVTISWHSLQVELQISCLVIEYMHSLL